MDPIPYQSRSRKLAANLGGEKLPEDTMWCDYGYSEEEEKPTEESIGMSLDEAKKIVKEKVEKMGITDLQFSNWNYAVCNNLERIIVQVILEMDIQLIIHVL